MYSIVDPLKEKRGASVGDTAIAVLFAALVFLPSSTVYNIIRLSLVAVVFIFKYYSGEEQDKALNKVALCMAVSPLLSGGIVFVMELGSSNTTLLIHEIQRMFFCAMLIITVKTLNLNFRIIYIITVLVLIPNFIIQILEYLQVGAVFDFIQSHYVFSDAEGWSHLDLAIEGSGQSASLRYGSIFVNPNIYNAIPLFSIVVFLHQDQQKKGIINYALIVCAVISGLMTGSRTATVVMAIILGIYIFRYANFWGKVIFVLAVAFVAFKFGSELLTERAFKLNNATEDSLGVKINQFGWYYSHTNFLYWITGSLGSSTAIPFDSEIGHILGWYGVFGIYWYFQYFKYIWKNCNENIVFYTKPLVYISLLVAFTSSILLCMPIYPFAALVLFSNIDDIKSEHKAYETENVK